MNLWLQLLKGNSVIIYQRKHSPSQHHYIYKNEAHSIHYQYKSKNYIRKVFEGCISILFECESSLQKIYYSCQSPKHYSYGVVVPYLIIRIFCQQPKDQQCIWYTGAKTEKNPDGHDLESHIELVPLQKTYYNIGQRKYYMVCNPSKGIDMAIHNKSKMEFSQSYASIIIQFLSRGFCCPYIDYQRSIMKREYNQILNTMVLLPLLIVITNFSSIRNKLIEVDSFFETMKLIQSDTDYLASLMIISSHPDCTNCMSALDMYQAQSQESNGVVKAYLIDCEKIPKNEIPHLQACNQVNIPKLPQLTYLTPPEVEPSPYENQEARRPKENRLKGELSIASLRRSIDEYAPVFHSKINSRKQLVRFLNDTTIPTKVILVTNNDTIPLWFRGLTSYFRSKLDFAWVNTEKFELPEEYKLSGMYPDILIFKLDLETNQYKQISYTGGRRLDSLKASLSRYASKEKIRRWKSQYERDHTRWTTTQQINHLELNNLMSKELWIMIHFKSQDKTHDRFQPLKEQFRGLFETFECDCSGIECQQWLKEKLKIGQVPALIIYPLNNKVLIDFYEVTPTDTVDYLSELLTSDLPKSSKIYQKYNERQLFWDMKESLSENLFPIIWFSNTTDSFDNLIAATISELPKYKKLLKFYFLRDIQESARKKWNIISLPHIVGFTELNFESGQHKTLEFQETFTIENLYDYFDQLAFHNEQMIGGKKAVDESTTQLHFELLCLETNQPCAIAILGDSFMMDLDALEKARYALKSEQISWTWIDARCQPALMKRLKLYDTPQFFYYQPDKSRYSILNYPYNTKNIMDFITLVRQGDKRFKKIKIDDYLDLQDVNCDAIKKEAQKIQNKVKNDSQTKAEQQVKATKKSLYDAESDL